MDERNDIVVPVREVHIELRQAGVDKENHEDQAVNNCQAEEEFVKSWSDSVIGNHNDCDYVGKEPQRADTGQESALNKQNLLYDRQKITKYLDVVSALLKVHGVFVFVKALLLHCESIKSVLLLRDTSRRVCQILLVSEISFRLKCKVHSPKWKEFTFTMCFTVVTVFCQIKDTCHYESCR